MADYFERLNYSLGDEDTALEYALLPQHARHVVGVSGCGGRLLPLLARSPARMTCVDISAPQLAFTRLRFALLEQTDHESFMDFMGFLSGASAKRRQSIFRHLDLPPPDRRWLADLFHSRHWGAPVYMGAFEQTLQRLAKINGLFTGKAGRAIFQCRDLGEQSAYYRRHFPLKRWKAVIARAKDALPQMDADEIMIIGGAEVYRQALPIIERIYLTVVEGDFAGSVYFPSEIDEAFRAEIQHDERVAIDEKNVHPHRFLILDRRMEGPNMKDLFRR